MTRRSCHKEILSGFVSSEIGHGIADLRISCLQDQARQMACVVFITVLLVLALSYPVEQISASIAFRSKSSDRVCLVDCNLRI